MMGPLTLRNTMIFSRDELAMLTASASAFTDTIDAIGMVRLWESPLNIRRSLVITSWPVAMVRHSSCDLECARPPPTLTWPRRVEAPAKLVVRTDRVSINSAGVE